MDTSNKILSLRSVTRTRRVIALKNTPFQAGDLPAHCREDLLLVLKRILAPEHEKLLVEAFVHSFDGWCPPVDTLRYMGNGVWYWGSIRITMSADQMSNLVLEDDPDVSGSAVINSELRTASFEERTREHPLVRDIKTMRLYTLIYNHRPGVASCCHGAWVYTSLLENVPRRTLVVPVFPDPETALKSANAINDDDECFLTLHPEEPSLTVAVKPIEGEQILNLCGMGDLFEISQEDRMHRIDTHPALETLRSLMFLYPTKRKTKI